MLRDFKKHVGLSADEVPAFLNTHISTHQSTDSNDHRKLKNLLGSLRTYYTHQIELSQGYIKDPMTRNEYIAIITGWIHDIDTLLNVQ